MNRFSFTLIGCILVASMIAIAGGCQYRYTASLGPDEVPEERPAVGDTLIVISVNGDTVDTAYLTMKVNR